MLNERTKNMEIESCFVPKKNASNYQDYWKISEFIPPENSTDLKEVFWLHCKKKTEVIGFG